jgi:hypothetical protein
VALAAPKASFGETLPSKDDARSGRRPTGGRVVSVNIVIGLVLAGFAAGFLLGWAVGRM